MFKLVEISKEEIEIVVDNNIEINFVNQCKDRILFLIKKYPYINFNLKRVGFISSDGLNFILYINMFSQNEETEIIFTNLNENVKNIINIVGLNEVINIK